MAISAPWRRDAALTCQELVELVSEYLEATLTRAERRRFERHIAGCPACTAYLQQLRAVHDRLGRLGPADLSLETELELRRAFAGWRAGQ